MCGIVGLYLKNGNLGAELGELFAPMLIEMTDRGPDSAGVAVYRDRQADLAKITVFHPDPEFGCARLCDDLGKALDATVSFESLSTHHVITTDADIDEVERFVNESDPEIQVMSAGKSIEIFKETGLPGDVLSRFGIDRMAGTHMVGHTRMATESAVTTAGSHPYSTGMDICLVHNGSLSNHNRLREKLKRTAGASFKTDNDTEVAAAFISSKLDAGSNLHQALEDCLDELDGFYTFVAGTADGFAVLRDPIACKPAVLAENDDYVAFGSEYRALVSLPGIKEARVWEPEPAIVYSWGGD